MYLEYSNYNYDLLLEYLSRKEVDSFSNFKKYVLGLNYELTYENFQKKFNKKILEGHNEVKTCQDAFTDEKNRFISAVRRMLSRLGHCEFYFDTNKSTCMIAPIVISLSENNSYTGVLCGKRTSDIIEELQELCNACNIVYREENNPDAPKAIFIEFENQTKKELFESKLCEYEYIKDLKVVEGFSKKVLLNIPKVTDIINAIESDEFEDNMCNIDVENNKVIYNSFDLRNIQFRLYTKSEEICNNWHIIENKERDYHKLYYLYYQKNYYLIDKHYGILISLYKNQNKIKQKLLSWNNNKLIKENLALQFPELIERALTLACGYNVKIDNRKITYNDIDKLMAELLSEITGLEIKYE